LSDEKFFRKKQLLAQRDDLLEEIGQSIFDEGDLPESFRSLPQEFRSRDKLLSQLRDRYRALKEERDRVHIEDQDLLGQMAKVERKHDKSQAELRRELGELSLRLDHLKDQQRRSRLFKKEDALADLTRRMEELNTELSKREAARRKDREGLQEKMAPVQDRLRKLDEGIRQVQDEEEHLSLFRRKRLEDLGSWHYANRRDSERFFRLFNQLDRLKKELTDNRKTGRVENWDAPVKEARGHWRLFAALLIAALAIGYFFRIEFRNEEASLSGLLIDFSADQGDEVIYANLSRVSPAWLEAELPAFGELPGGNAFRDLTLADLEETLAVRTGDNLESVRCFAVKFKKAPPRVAVRMRQAGWHFTSAAGRWQAWTDPDETWGWLSWNERTFLLAPAKDLARLGALASGGNNVWLFLNCPTEPFGPNAKLLNGFEDLTLILGPETFTLTLTAPAPLSDFELRAAYLDHLTQNAENSAAAIALERDRLSMTASSGLLQPTSYSPPELGRFARRVIEGLEASAHAKPFSPEGQATLPYQRARTAAPEGFTQRLTAFRFDERQGLEELDATAFNGVISGLTYLRSQDALLVSDELNHSVTLFRVERNRLRLRNELSLAGGGETGAAGPTGGLPFAPRLLAPTPDERYAVVLERRTAARPAFLALIDLHELKTVWLEELPRRTDYGVSAAWNETGDLLFIGCAARKQRRPSAPAVLVYRRQEGILTLSRLIDLDLGAASWLHISAVTLENPQSLLLRQEPLGRLVRYPLDRGDRVKPEALNMIGTPFASPAEQRDVGGRNLLTSRTGHFAFFFDLIPGPSTGSVQLANLKAPQLAAVDILPLDASPYYMARAPLSDRFWLTAPAERKLMLVKIENNRLVLDRELSFEKWRPELLAIGHWGRAIFVSGKGEE